MTQESRGEIISSFYFSPHFYFKASNYLFQAAVVYIIDISEECGTPIEKQVALFRKIKPLFQGKPVFVMLNKIDVKPWDELAPENKELLEEFLKQEDVKFYKTSNVSKEGIMDLRNEACDDLLRQVFFQIFSFFTELPDGLKKFLQLYL